jgi:hypothetical protein
VKGASLLLQKRLSVVRAVVSVKSRCESDIQASQINEFLPSIFCLGNEMGSDTKTNVLDDSDWRKSVVRNAR